MALDELLLLLTRLFKDFRLYLVFGAKIGMIVILQVITFSVLVSAELISSLNVLNTHSEPRYLHLRNGLLFNLLSNCAFISLCICTGQ